MGKGVGEGEVKGEKAAECEEKDGGIVCYEDSDEEARGFKKRTRSVTFHI